MRNLLDEFDRDHGLRPPTILGVREHVFTGRYFLVLWMHYFSLSIFMAAANLFISFYFSVSSLASFMSNQETSFVTLGQRVLANPLK